MRHKVYRLFINFEKEEMWLNEMAAKGFNLIDYRFGRYLFEEGTPGEYIYRIELLSELASHPQSKAYLHFIEELGVECVCTYIGWVYLRKRASEGPFDLYTDYDSRINHYKRVAWLVGTLGLANLVIAVSNILITILNNSAPRHLSNMYFSSINAAVVVFFTPMFISYLRKIRKMKKEKQLHE